MKSQLTGKDPDAGKDWGKVEKWATEDEMCGWHHWLNGMSLSKLWEMVKDREAWLAAAMGSQRAGRHLWLNYNNHVSRWCCCWLVITYWTAWRRSKASFVKICIYLAAMGLSCRTRIFDLHCRLRDLVPWPGIEPEAPGLGAQSLSHWTTREVPLKHLNALHHVPAKSCGRPGELK